MDITTTRSKGPRTISKPANWQTTSNAARQVIENIAAIPFA